jgi:hypothetical protein
MDQQIKVAQLITKQTLPLPSGSFSITMDGTVPADIQLLSLPAAVEGIAPQLRGFGYVVGPETGTAGCELAVAMSRTSASAMRDRVDQPKASKAQQADENEGHGVYEHPMSIIILAFRAFVFREVRDR